MLSLSDHESSSDWELPKIHMLLSATWSGRAKGALMECRQRRSKVRDCQQQMMQQKIEKQRKKE